MDVVDKIQEKIDKGLYTVTVFGSREALYEEVYDDIESLLILFRAKNRAIEERIKQLEENFYDTTTKHGVHDFNVNSAIINELKNLL